MSLFIRRARLSNRSVLSNHCRIQYFSEDAKTVSFHKAALTKVKAYAELSKFRLSSLVVFTSGAGYALAGAPIDACTMLAACFGTALCAASAGTFNQIIEKDRDAMMSRTRLRPLPSGKVTVPAASVWGVGTAAAGTGLLFAATNPTVAALGAFNIFLYSVPYTYSKQYSEVNTWIGSIVGAIPPVMGWAAATGGSLLAAEPLAAATALFLWQFPHFFALSWLHRQDYARGNFQMVAVNDPQGVRSAKLIWDYSLMLAALPIVTSATGMTSWMFAVEGSAINLYLLSLAHAFKHDQTNAKARKVFLTSLWYLPVLLMAMVFHSRNWNKDSLDQDNAALISEEDSVALAVTDARETLKGLCPHELLSTSADSREEALPMVVPKPLNAGTSLLGSIAVQNNSSSVPVASGKHAHLCVKLKADAVLDASSEIVQDAVHVASDVATNVVVTAAAALTPPSQE